MATREVFLQHSAHLALLEVCQDLGSLLTRTCRPNEDAFLGASGPRGLQQVTSGTGYQSAAVPKTAVHAIVKDEL